jgi:hypothetical protein
LNFVNCHIIPKMKIVLLTVSYLLASFAIGQAGPATVTGNVTDSAHAPLAYATISLFKKAQTD